MVVNDNAYKLDKRSELESIASKLAPTVSRECVKNLFFFTEFWETRAPPRSSVSSPRGAVAVHAPQEVERRICAVGSPAWMPGWPMAGRSDPATQR
ncbi:hypothetical protein C1X64_08810 [Pseudomonas sp. GW456-E7]|nr:hypothetical protein C1X64_08810 [Pseudomonas sp. GW456-E7]